MPNNFFSSFSLKLKKSFMNETFKSIIKKPSFILYSVLFDGLFALIVYEINVLMETILPGMTTGAALTVMFVRLLTIVFAASLFKLLILDEIGSVFRDKNTGLKRLPEFYFLNLAAWSVFILLILAINTGIVFIFRQEYVQTAGSVMIVLVFLIIYLVLNVIHSMFGLGKDLKKSLKGFMISFSRIKSWLPVYGLGLAVFAAYLLVYSLIGILTSLFIGADASFAFLSGYMKVAAIMSMAIVYLLIVFNRAYFYLIAKKQKL